MHQDRLNPADLVCLGFTPAWVAAGVVNVPVLTALMDRWEKGEDRYTEHYRLTAFRTYLDRHQTLTTEQFDQLWTLGVTDQDQSFGTSMLITLIRLPDVPQAFLERALSSGNSALERATRRLLSERSQLSFSEW